MTQTIKSAESVRAGHPDKLCDQIADAVLDKVLTLDPEGRCACEAMATEGNIYVAGEISCKETLNIVSIVKDVLRHFRLQHKPHSYPCPHSRAKPGHCGRCRPCAGNKERAQIRRLAQETKERSWALPRMKHLSFCHFRSCFRTAFAKSSMDV